MNKEKQIEDMVKICHFHNDGICHLCEELLVSCDRKCDLAILVENLYTAGYRKASEVAREVIDDARRVLLNMVLANATGERIDLEKEFENIVKKYTQN